MFGRLVNGIPQQDVCTVAASTATATGEFVHIEQALISRQSAAYEGWGEVVRKTFEATCQEGTKEDIETGLCIEA